MSASENDIAACLKWSGPGYFQHLSVKRFFWREECLLNGIPQVTICFSAEQQTRKNPLGAIPIALVTDVVETGDTSFKLTLSHTDFTFTSADIDQRAAWVSSIRRDIESVGQSKNDKVWLEEYCAQFPLKEFGLSQASAPSSKGIPHLALKRTTMSMPCRKFRLKQEKFQVAEAISDLKGIHHVLGDLEAPKHPER
ncbi:MAG: hypothetical protein M1813_008847 [Trichoglossum hirsutum]|nr:MAG: hypothetical protein M1813_008847 [Trichoglossum hirsutum]